jgi:hypothetical protein
LRDGEEANERERERERERGIEKSLGDEGERGERLKENKFVYGIKK